MGPLGHAAVSLPLSLAVWAFTGDSAAGVATFFAGTLIDVDHVVDYVATRGLKVDLAQLRTGEYFREAGRAFVVLHSYELVVLAALALGFFVRPALGLGLAVGAIAHLVCDVVFYRFTPLCYSLMYRFRTQFALGSFRHVRLGAEGGAKTR